MNAANPHRAGTKAAERFDRVQAAAAERARKQAKRAELKIVGQAPLDARAPADFGVMRTRAWLKAYRRLRSAIKHGSVGVLHRPRRAAPRHARVAAQRLDPGGVR